MFEFWIFLSLCARFKQEMRSEIQRLTLWELISWWTTTSMLPLLLPVTTVLKLKASLRIKTILGLQTVWHELSLIRISGRPNSRSNHVGKNINGNRGKYTPLTNSIPYFVWPQLNVWVDRKYLKLSKKILTKLFFVCKTV